MKVKFVPQNVEFDIESTQSVKEVADKNGIFIKSVCNGLPSCAECRVRVVEGDHNVLPPSTKELSLIGTGYYIDQRRLSCQLHCYGDVTVDLSEQVEKQKNQSLRRPQGGARKVEEVPTRAVVGNLIEQEKAIFQEAPKAAATEARPSAQRPQSQDRGAQPSRHREAGSSRQRHSQTHNHRDGGGRKGGSSQQHQQQNRSQGRNKS